MTTGRPARYHPTMPPVMFTASKPLPSRYCAACSAAAADVAEDVHGAIAGNLVETCRERAERDVLGALDPGLRDLVGLAHVEDVRVVGGVHLCRGDASHGRLLQGRCRSMRRRCGHPPPCHPTRVRNPSDAAMLP